MNSVCFWFLCCYSCSNATLFPSILLAPSYGCPLQILNWILYLRKASMIALTIVWLFMFVNWWNPRSSSWTSKFSFTDHKQNESFSFLLMLVYSSPIFVTHFLWFFSFFSRNYNVADDSDFMALTLIWYFKKHFWVFFHDLNPFVMYMASLFHSTLKVCFLSCVEQLKQSTESVLKHNCS